MPQVDHEGLTKEEQETIIIWNEGEQKWIATSCIGRHIAKFVKSKWIEILDGSASAPYRRFEHNKSTAIVLRDMVGRTYTEEQRQALKDRFAKARAERGTKKAEELIAKASLDLGGI